jgi:uncharacterized protein (DUF1697 family)
VATQTHILLLRAVNVGGTGKLPMADLRTLCEGLGLRRVRTYIQSGNVVATGALSAAQVKTRLEKALLATLGKPCRVLVRSLAEMEQVEQGNPFPEAAPAQLLVLFLDDAPPRTAVSNVKVPGSERLALRGRELYIHFPDGMGQSKLRIPFADTGTGRNLNTVRKLIALAGAEP